eukprot:m.27574 g.27574  ORF g.27574 m.27574 type:complete len:121 (+) comp11936_c0_seq1:142-504(+)
MSSADIEAPVVHTDSGDKVAKPAEMVGGRRRPHGHPTKVTEADPTAPVTGDTVITPQDGPEDALVETEFHPPPKEYQKMPKYEAKREKAYKQPNQKSNSANRGLQGGIQRPQNVGTNGRS